MLPRRLTARVCVSTVPVQTVGAMQIAGKCIVCSLQQRTSHPIHIGHERQHCPLRLAALLSIEGTNASYSMAPTAHVCTLCCCNCSKVRPQNGGRNLPPPLGGIDLYRPQPHSTRPLATTRQSKSSTQQTQ